MEECLYMRKITVLFAIFILLLAGCSQEAKNTFKITLDPNYEGGQPEEITTDTNGLAQMPVIQNDGNRQGYTKIGWADTATAKTAKYLPMRSYSFSSSVTLYSVWEPKTYNITYVYNNGTNDKTTKPFTIEDKVTALDIGNITREGYSFVGWCEKTDGTGKVYSSGDILTFNDDVTLYGIWSVNTYYIEYDANEGTGTIPKANYYGYQDATIEKASRLSREGYAFDGWNTEADGTGTNYDADATYYGRESIKLYAKWKALKKVTLTYSANGADAGSVPSSQEVYEGTTISVPGQGNLTKANYTFAGWNTKSDNSGVLYKENSSLIISDNVTLYAVWKENAIVKIVYNSNGGEGTVSELSVHAGEEFTLDGGSSLTRENYQFVKWNTKANGTGTDYLPGNKYTVTQDTTLYAQWKYLYEGLKFTFNETYGRYDVSAENTAITEVNIPVTYGNYKVAIAREGFKGCSNLKSIVIPSGIADIGNLAFSASGVETVTISEGITKIPTSCFLNCKSLKNVVFPSSLSSIGASAFEACSSLKSVDIQNTVVTELGGSAFCQCTSLESIKLPECLKTIADGNMACFRECTSLRTIDIPSGVTTIGQSSFYRCYLLESIELPSGLTKIEQEMFISCSSLKSVIIPASVTSIGYYVFQYCTALTEIKISKTMSTAKSLLTNASVPSGVTVVCTNGSYTTT